MGKFTLVTIAVCFLAFVFYCKCGQYCCSQKAKLTILFQFFNPRNSSSIAYQSKNGAENVEKCKTSIVSSTIACKSCNTYYK